MALVSEAHFTDIGFRVARFFLAIGVFLMPLLAISDYSNNYYIPAFVKLVSFFICLGGYIFSRNPGSESLVRLIVSITLLLMSLTGAFYKLDSSLGIILISVLPAMFCFLAGIRIGVLLSSIYLMGYTFSYINFYDFHGVNPVSFEIWMHSIIVYLLILCFSAFFGSEKRKDEVYFKNAAERDYLTNVNNRRGFVPKLESEILRSERYDSPLSMILFDVDHFKQVNDRFGHAEGDRLLVSLAALIKASIRNSDVIGRWGGEEFIILTPESDVKAAQDLAHKLRENIENYEFPGIGHITASFGVTQFIKGEKWDKFVDRADIHLYRAKKQGRNRVISD